MLNILQIAANYVFLCFSVIEHLNGRLSWCKDQFCTVIIIIISNSYVQAAVARIFNCFGSCFVAIND